MIFPHGLQNLYDLLKTEKDDLSVLKKNNKMMFSLAWNNLFTVYGKVLVLNSSEMGNTVFFFIQKVGVRYVSFSKEEYLVH